MILLCFGVLFPFKVFSQGAITIDHYTKDYGQSLRWVYDIAQDDQGFMWFGTHTGLRRYDGTDFTVYQHTDGDTSSISTNTILRITTGNDNTIWSYGSDDVFNKMDLISGKFTSVRSFLKDGQLVTTPLLGMKHFKALTNGDFIAMFQEYDTLKQSSSCSFWKYNVGRNVFEHQLDVATQGTDILYFSERDDSKLWLWGMGEGYYLVDLSNKTIEHYAVNSTILLPSLPIDDRSNFWYPNPLSKGRETLNSFNLPAEIDVSKIERIRPDNLGNIWFYHGSDNLFRFDVETGTLDKFVDPIFRKSNGIQIMYHMFEDKAGKYWNGHFFGAIRFTKQPINQFASYLNGSELIDLSDTQISIREIIELSPTSLLVKENRQDLFIVDLVTQRSRKLNPKINPTFSTELEKKFYSMVLSRDGYLWMNQFNKVVRLNMNTEEVESFEAPVSTTLKSAKEDPFEKYWPRIFMDATDNLWLCDQEGLYQFDKSNKVFVPVQVEHTPLSVGADFKFASYDPAADAIYGSYDQGIYSINCENKSVKIYEIFSDQEYYDILVFAILKWKDEFWLSTNKGLVRYHPETKKRTVYNANDGISSNVIFSALGGKKHLWLATQMGLNQFDPNSLQVTTFYKEQGLPYDAFNIGSYQLTSDGKMYFGGPNGIVGFTPDDFDFSNKEKGQLNLVDVIKYNQEKDSYSNIQNLPYSIPETIIIEPSERTVTFKYMLAMYDNINSNQYFHYMEGLDHDWINDGDRNEVQYLQLPPGNYTFHVKAKGPHKASALNEIVIPILVKQYWYLRWWAIVTYILLMSTAIYLLYRFQLHHRLNKQTVRRMKELDIVKTKMYTNITHEFRTPLTVILGMNDAVKDYAVDGEIDKVQHANEMIDRNGKKLLTLVNQILELSKLESGLLEIHNQQGNIVDYLRYRLEAFESYAIEKGITIHFQPLSEEIIMDYDVDKLSYMVDNLLSNAIKFTAPNGNIYVSIGKQLHVDNESYFELKVRDTGIGIEENQLAHIFNRFYQVDNSHTRKVEGTGIGLSLVKELVHLLNGKINVNSKINEGSEFIITLPITMNAKVDTSNFNNSNEWSGSLYNSVLEDEAYLSQDQGIPLILIVEDNADVSHYIGVSINDAYRIVTAPNGNEGLEKARTLIPDVIISDVMMPLKDGFELCDVIKKDERTSHIPVILLTGKVDVDSKIEGLEHGADDYLTKPFNRKELLARLKNLMTLRAEIQKRYAETDFSHPISIPATTENTFLLKIRITIIDHLEDDDFDITQLCKLMYLSRAQLHRKLIALTGESTSVFIRKVQLQKAQELLSSGELNVSEVAFQTGFKTQAHFSRVFSETFGVSPSSYRN